jgi:hypothetical protein
MRREANEAASSSEELQRGPVEERQALAMRT